jgi:hypothetical protein
VLVGPCPRRDLGDLAHRLVHKDPAHRNGIGRWRSTQPRLARSTSFLVGEKLELAHLTWVNGPLSVISETGVSCKIQGTPRSLKLASDLSMPSVGIDVSVLSLGRLDAADHPALNWVSGQGDVPLRLAIEVGLSVDAGDDEVGDERSGVV